MWTNLRRHNSAFRFEQVALSDVRRVAEDFRAKIEYDDRQKVFFENESEADQWANRFVLAQLQAMAKEDPIAAERSIYLLARGVFVAALYT
jgi:hypothetical protein